MWDTEIRQDQWRIPKLNEAELFRTRSAVGERFYKKVICPEWLHGGLWWLPGKLLGNLFAWLSSSVKQSCPQHPPYNAASLYELEQSLPHRKCIYFAFLSNVNTVQLRREVGQLRSFSLFLWERSGKHVGFRACVNLLEDDLNLMVNPLAGKRVLSLNEYCDIQLSSLLNEFL